MRDYKRLRYFLKIAVFSIAAAIYASAQTAAEPPSRSITSIQLQAKRPASPVGGRKNSSRKQLTPVSNQKRRKSINVVTNPGRRYKLVKRVIRSKNSIVDPSASAGRIAPNANKSKFGAVLQDEELGVTFWRLRQLKKEEEDDAPTFTVNTGDGIEQWTAERVNSSNKFKVGDRIRLTIESMRSGYIYIINREIYNDGTTGEAHLIYPATNGRGRQDNLVKGGSLIEIPGTNEDFPYFNVEPRVEKYEGEEMIVIISPNKLSGFTYGAEFPTLRRVTLQKWFEEWFSETDIYDASDGEGVAYTRTEAEAVKTRSLTREEPLPQTIYRFKSIAGKPLMMSFQMLVKKP